MTNTTTDARLIAERTGLPENSVKAVLRLLQDGATLPFIARYRKEATGQLDEVQIAAIAAEEKQIIALQKRKTYILSTIEEAGKLTPELKKRILQCQDPTLLEDLYLPYKSKRKTRAESARQRGLGPLANWVWRQEKGDPKREAQRYLNKDIKTVNAALEGARDIIAEKIAEDGRARQVVRRHFRRSAIIHSKAARGKKAEAGKYRDYLQFAEPLRNIPSHRFLAIFRGQQEGLLSVSIRPEEDPVLHELGRLFLRGHSPATNFVRQALEDGYARLLAPSIETEFRNTAKEKADRAAIDIFANNLRQLLLAPPLGSKRIMGIDPGFRTGCKVVALDENGQLLASTTVFPHPPRSKTLESARTLADFARQHRLEVLAIGNGTAGRETYEFCQGVDFATPPDLFLVDESGASIYSASAIAREEFPEEDITVRGAVSIGRRLLDPLAELVKIDPKSIGVGQYQHDVNPSALKESLDQTVVSAVNSVGIDINTASQHLLTYVSGLGPTLAGNIVQYRSTNGRFRSRNEIKKIPRLGAKAFEQCAGFLRIRNGKNPLDNTAVHPERYDLVKKMASDLNIGIDDLLTSPELRQKIDPNRYVSADTGMATLRDILTELEKPGRDPRGEAKPLVLSSISKIEDLREGMTLAGTVTNVTAFGAFVDIGVKENGLVHVSQMADRFVKDPAQVVSLRQQVRVRIVSIDLDRKRIALSMKDV